MTRILLIEDDPIVRDLLQLALRGCGYQVVAAATGAEGWQQLQAAPRGGAGFEAVLLDRQLPDADGIELLRRIKGDPALCGLPVIIESSVADTDMVRVGLQAGAYYYLTKPLQLPLVMAVLQAAITQRRETEQVQAAVRNAGQALHMLGEGTFHCRTLEEARELAQALALACPNPARVVLGLHELLINAVEHGNLDIGYAEKTELLLEGRWHDEVARRLADATWAQRRVTVQLARTAAALTLTVQDEGAGFDWQPYLDLSPERAFDPHGRGIAMARMGCFDAMEYLGNGNTVRVTLQRPACANDEPSPRPERAAV